jgi:hypothetical protein
MNPDAQIWDSSVNPPELVQVRQPNSWQEAMWEDYNWCIEETKRLADGDDVVPYHDGDITQGSKYPVHLVAHGIKNQAMIAHWNMMPWLEQIPQIEKFNFIAGTPSHIGFEGTALLHVYEAMVSDYPDVKFGLSHHALHNLGTDLLDIAHHGPAKGTRKWLEGNQLRYYMKDIFLSAMVSGRQPPRIIIRAHFHTPDEETITEKVGDKFYKVTGIMLPSFSGINGYARQITKSVSHVTNGICCLEIIDGELKDTHWFTKTRDVRSYKKL